MRLIQKKIGRPFIARSAPVKHQAAIAPVREERPINTLLFS
jgi:hypothetical protein